MLLRLFDNHANKESIFRITGAALEEKLRRDWHYRQKYAAIRDTMAAGDGRRFAVNGGLAMPLFRRVFQIANVRLRALLLAAFSALTATASAQDVAAGSASTAETVAMNGRQVSVSDRAMQNKQQKRYREYNSWNGAGGGIRVIDALSGVPGAARFQLAIDAFSEKDFLYRGDRVSQTRQSLSFGWAASPTASFTEQSRTEPQTAAGRTLLILKQI